MALRPTILRNAAQAVAYYGAELGESDYYLKEKGIWFGALRERLGLGTEVTREEFVALMNNRTPNDVRLTPRTNGTRKKTVWERDEKSGGSVQVEREISNRRVATDWTFSLEKDKSVYLAATHDHEAESLAHKAMIETLGLMEADVQTRVRKDGADENRHTGNGLFGIFIHRTTRPIGGIPDPHWHAHVVQVSATFDDVEQRYKAAELGALFENKAKYETFFHARVEELWLGAGYGMRRTDKGLELTVTSREENRIFCKRTIEIEKTEEKLRGDLNRKAAAIVIAAARKGQLLEHEVVYGKLKDKLGERSRKGKDTLSVNGQALEAEWSKQLAPGRWDAITAENARNGDRIGFLDAETAKTLAIQHAFAKESVIRDSDLFKSIHLFGCGTMSVADMQEFCATDPRLVHNEGLVTTHEIIAEEQAIRDIVVSLRSKYEPISTHLKLRAVDKLLDAGQLAAVDLVLSTRDLAIAVPGYTGSGKSRTVKETAHAVREITGHSVLVLAPTGRSAKALGFAAGANEAHTIAFFRTCERLQKQARGRSIFVDEFSLINNDDGKWLLDFAKENGCRLVFWGDGRQHIGVSRGSPICDLLDAGLLDFRELNVIYRQTNEVLKAAVLDAAEGRYKESFAKVQAAGWITVEDNERLLRAKLVDAMLGEITQHEPALCIALQHKHGDQIATELRAKLKESGLLGADDIQVKTLRDLQLTQAQLADPVNYSAGQTVKFHRKVSGGFNSGESWTVEPYSYPNKVMVSRNGIRKQLPLSSSVAFQLFESRTILIAVGDQILMTRNNPQANVKTGEVLKVKAINDSIRIIVLDNGATLDISEGVHIRQGYTITSQGAQGHQAGCGFAYLPASAANQMNQRQWLVDISRAVSELRVFTDCPEILEQNITRSEEKKTALSFVHNGKTVMPITYADRCAQRAVARSQVVQNQQKDVPIGTRDMPRPTITPKREIDRGRTWER